MARTIDVSDLPEPLVEALPQMLAPLRRARAIKILPLHESAVMRLGTLPSIHRDPFDRMRMCQALDEGMTSLTPDAAIRAYPVPTLW